MLAKVTTKGQVRNPRGIRDAFGIRPNEKVDFEREGENCAYAPQNLARFAWSGKAEANMSIADEKKVARAGVAQRVMDEMRCKPVLSIRTFLSGISPTTILIRLTKWGASGGGGCGQNKAYERGAGNCRS